MKGLFIKDLRLMMMQKRFFIMILLIAISMVAVTGDISFIVGYLTFICPLFCISTISYDEFDNGYAFLFTLPIQKKDYVKEKYAFALTLAIGSWLISMIMMMIYQTINSHSFLIYDDLLGSFVVLAIFAIIFSILLPLKLKFGAEKSNIAQMIVFGVTFVGAMLFIKLIDILHIDLSPFVTFINQLSFVSISLICLLISLLVIFISYQMSLHIMQKKEF